MSLLEKNHPISIGENEKKSTRGKEDSGKNLGVWEREGAWFREGHQEGEYMMEKRTSLLKSRLHYCTEPRDGWPSSGMNSVKCAPISYPFGSLLVSSKPSLLVVQSQSFGIILHPFLSPRPTYNLS